MKRSTFWLLMALIAFLIPANTARAQIALGTNSFPPQQYYLSFLNYYQGDYRSSFNDWKNATGAFRIGSDRFLDSCCYWTMAGECQFHTGNYSQAIDYYEQSLNLYLTYTKNNWQQRIQAFNIPNALPQAVQRTQITWGQPARPIKIPSLPNTIGIMFGELGAAERALQVGGVVIPAEIKQVDVAEIMRCTAISMHRRRWIKGAVCKYERLTLDLASAFEQSNVADGTLIGAWNGVLLGIAYASIEDYANAKRTLEGSLQFGDGLDHPLTPIALLELADVNFRLGDTKSAAYLALEASYSAAIFNQYDVMEEALSLGTMLHLSSKTAGPYPPLENAIVWSRKNRALLPQASLMIRLAECYSEAGDSASSARILGDAIKAFNARSGFGSGNLEGRANYLAAVNLFIDGDFDQGLARLQRALKEFTPVSRWIYQLRLTEAYAVSGAISERHAEVMYESLLRDPTELEWRSDPIEAITFLATPHLDSIRRWMGIVASKRDFQQLIAIAELFRRHRFYTELPLAGRDLGLRWTMHAPEQALTTRALNQRVDFFTRYPAYKTLSDQIEQIRQKLANQPLQETPGSPEQKEQVNQYVELMQQCKKAEALLASIGLRREPSEMVFPPQPILLELSKILQPNQTVVYVIATPNQHLFLEYTTRGTRLMASIPNKDMFAILKNIFSDTTLEDRQLDPKVLEKDDWHKMVTEVAQTLIPDIVLEYYGEAPPELIIIPDGLAWYLPFEMLRVPGGEAETQWLWQAARMRYSPTLGLAVQPQRPSRPWRRTAFFTGNLSDTVKPEIAAAAFAQLHQAFPAIVDFPERLDIPSAWFGSTCDEFVVWTQLGRLPKGGPFALTPVIKDRASNGSNLASWLSLPWRGAEHLILPTFESEAANGVKGKPDGDELFLLTTGLMASGSRTILLSRWTTGGKSTLDFTTDYWQLARDQSPVVAYQEALRKTQDRPVEFAMEPRIASSKEPLEGKATHPVFWAGYMLFDIPTVPGIPLPEPPDQDLKLPAEGQQDQDEQDDVDDDAMKKEGDGDGGDGGGNAGDNGRGDGGAGLGS